MLYFQCVVDPTTGFPTSELSQSVRVFCQECGSDTTTLQPIANGKDEAVTKVIQVTSL